MFYICDEIFQLFVHYYLFFFFFLFLRSLPRLADAYHFSENWSDEIYDLNTEWAKIHFLLK